MICEGADTEKGPYGRIPVCTGNGIGGYSTSIKVIPKVELQSPPPSLPNELKPMFETKTEMCCAGSCSDFSLSQPPFLVSRGLAVALITLGTQTHNPFTHSKVGEKDVLILI